MRWAPLNRPRATAAGERGHRRRPRGQTDATQTRSGAAEIREHRAALLGHRVGLAGTASVAPGATDRAQVRRTPVPVGDHGFFDADIPALLEREEFREETTSSLYRVVETEARFLFEHKTGLYFTPDRETQIRPSSLAPSTQQVIGAAGPPGADTVEPGTEPFDEMLVKTVVSGSRTLAEMGLLEEPLRLDPQDLPEAPFPAEVLVRMVQRIIVPDLLGLLNEYATKSRRDLAEQRDVILLLINTFRITPRTNARLLGIFFDLFPAVSDRLVEVMPDVAQESLPELTYRDEMENREAAAQMGYEQAVNRLTPDLKGVETKVEYRQQLLAEAQARGFNFAGFLKQHRNRYGELDQHVQINIAIDELGAKVEEMKQKVGASGGVSEWLASIGITENVDLLIARLTRRGLSLDDVDWLVKQIRQQKHRCPTTQAEGQLAFLLSEHRELYEAPEHHTEAATFQTPAYETGVIDPMILDAVDRVQEGGNTIPQNDYIERHFTPAVMEFLVANPSVYVDVYEGKVGGALGDLALMGYTEIRPLSDNSATDFRKLIARNPETRKVVLVIVGLSGRAYQREIAAHFLYYNPPINPLRIQIHRLALEDAVMQEFQATLDSLGVVPDILQMGNVEQVERLLADKKIAPVGDIIAPNLYGKLYDINGKILFSLKVEPYLYADRAAELLRAVLTRKSAATVIFTGTAGALNKELQIGDIIAPETFSQADTLEPEPVEGVTNVAQELIGHDPERGMFGSGIHGAVDSILFEDQQWFALQKERLTIVEQEVAHLARAAAEARERVRLYAFFRISDVLGEQDFTQNETDRPEARTPVNQGELVVQILEQQLGELKDSGHGREVEKTIEQQGERILFQARGTAYTLWHQTGLLMRQLDPETERGFLTRLNEIVSSLKDEDPGELVTAISRLFQLYDLVPVIQQANPKTTVRIKYSGDSVDFELGDSTVALTGKPVKDGMMWIFSTDAVPEGKKATGTIVADDHRVEVEFTGGRGTFLHIES